MLGLPDSFHPFIVRTLENSQFHVKILVSLLVQTVVQMLIVFQPSQPSTPQSTNANAILDTLEMDILALLNSVHMDNALLSMDPMIAQLDHASAKNHSPTIQQTLEIISVLALMEDVSSTTTLNQFVFLLENVSLNNGNATFNPTIK